MYAGENSLSLVPPTRKRNVYLIGGLNGAGKTSLFSAIVLALYGAESAGLAFRRSHGDDVQQSYVRYIEDSFSLSARGAGENEMVVEVGMVHGGSEFQVQRTWWFDGGRFDDESLVVYVGGKPLRIFADTEVERVHILQEYVESIAPVRVAKFFFFDGEEIRQIASTSADEVVVEGLNQLLGLQVLRRLTDDLRTLKSSLRRESAADSTEALSEALGQSESLRVEVNELAAEVESARRDLAHAEEHIAVLDRELSGLFHGRAVQSRNEALDSLAALERDVAAVSGEIQSFVADVLTLTLPSKLLVQAVQGARRERDSRRIRAAKKRLAGLRNQIARRTFDRRDLRSPELTKSVRSFLKKRFLEVWDEILAAGDDQSRSIYGLFSDNDLEGLTSTYQQAVSTARRELTARLARRSFLQTEIDRVRDVQNLFETTPRTQDLLVDKGKTVEAIAHKRDVLVGLERRLEHVERERSTRQGVLTRLEAQSAAARRLREQADQIDRIELVVTTFMAELRGRRAASLSTRTTEMMRRLAHKEDLVHQVEIDPDSFKIRIRDRKAEEVVDLSAGEREILALSMVWGLSQISNRNLPVIIDTPLGRLDQMHRANIVEKFFPTAAEQVIVLSTDAEIDAKWHARLVPHLAQQVLIEFSASSQSSKLVSDRYLPADSAGVEMHG